MLSAMAKHKLEEVRINVRTRPDIKRDLEITARSRGITVSSLINLLVVREIREEKAKEPAAFAAPHAESRHGRRLASRSAGPMITRVEEEVKRRKRA